MGSYFAVPLVDRNRNVWGVLSVDTVLDGRQLTAADTGIYMCVFFWGGFGGFIVFLFSLSLYLGQESGVYVCVKLKCMCVAQDTVPDASVSYPRAEEGG